MSSEDNFKSGLAVLIGRTNVGKSTLLNVLVGTKIAIVTPRPQTTRDTFHGIMHRPEGQIVFVDTRDIQDGAHRLVQNLHHRVRDALEGIDVLVHVVDPSKPIGPEEKMVSEMLVPITQPKILCLNKIDLPELPYRETWLEHGSSYATVVEVSALRERNLELLVRAILGHLPVGERQYPDGQVTNVTNEFWVAELIREKVYLQTAQEVPYTATVQIEKIEDRPKGTLYIQAAILTTDDRHQRMLIGARGQKIKEIGSAARQELQVAMNRKIFLDLTVLVDNRWMDKMR